MSASDYLSPSAELRRLYSFLNWPADAAFNPFSLSRFGFTYTGTAFQTRCELCNLVVDRWSRGDNPLQVHRERSPLCPVVVTASIVPVPGSSVSESSTRDISARFQACSLHAAADQTPPLNAQLASTIARPIPRPAPSGIDVGGPAVSRSQSYHRSDAETSPQNASAIARGLPGPTAADVIRLEADADLHVATPRRVRPVAQSTAERPKHPLYSTFDARQRSFANGRVSRGQTPEGLARAGFFYVGPEDNVRCFQCSGGLKNFQATDDPWTEHARHFPRCSFLRQNTDQTFIDGCRPPASLRPAVPSRPSRPAAAAGATHACNSGLEPLSADTLLAVEENRQLREARTCRVCMDRDVDTVFLPCGHLVCCSRCSPELRNCAICRALIRGTVKVFLG